MKTDKYAGLEQAYKEDTVGRKYRKSIKTPMPARHKDKASDITSYALGKPMSRNEFLALPEDIQRTYIDFLRRTFCVSDSKIAGMMGMSISTLSMRLKRLDMRMNVHYTKSQLKKDAWQKFLNSAPQTEEEHTNEQPSTTRIEHKQVHFEVVGRFDLGLIETLIAANFAPEDNLRVSITVTKEEV